MEGSRGGLRISWLFRQDFLFLNTALSVEVQQAGRNGI